MSCTCLSETNTFLERRNVKLLTTSVHNLTTHNSDSSQRGPAITVVIIKKHKPSQPCVLHCTYCPFCGKKYID